MFEVGNSVIDSVEDAASPTASDLPALISKPSKKPLCGPSGRPLLEMGQRAAAAHACTLLVGRAAFKGPPLTGVECCDRDQVRWTPGMRSSRSRSSCHGVLQRTTNRK
jgi:hypothetical protein